MSAALFARALAGGWSGPRWWRRTRARFSVAQLRQATGLELPGAHFHKVRSKAGVCAHLVGAVSERAVVFDDILDTGGTLCRLRRGASRRRRAPNLRRGDPRSVHRDRVAAAGLSLGVDKLVCTDSVGTGPAADARVEVIACAPALLPGLRALGERFEAVA